MHAAFGQHAFLAVEGRVEAAVPAGAAAGQIGLGNFERGAVVTDEEDEGVFGEAVLFQRGSEEAHAVVHGGEHGEGLAAALGHFTGEAIEVFFRRIERDVGRAVGDVEEER